MKIYVSDKEIIENDLLDTERYDIVLTKYREDFWEEEIYPEIQSLEQHDAEIKKPLEDEIERLCRLCDKLNNDYFKQKEISDYGMKELNIAIRQLKQERQEVIAELEEFENEHRLRARKISEEYPTDNEEQKARLYALSSGRFDILEELKQKLKEMKGGKL